MKKEYIFLALIAIAFFSGGFFAKQYMQPSKDWKSELDSLNRRYDDIDSKLNMILKQEEKQTQSQILLDCHVTKIND